MENEQRSKPEQSGVNVISVPQPEHQRRRSLSVDSASTGISSLSRGNSGKRSLCSTVTSHISKFRSTVLQERTTGKATPCRTGARRKWT